MTDSKAHIKIRIGASVDASVAQVFKTVEQRAQAAAKATEAITKRAQVAAERDAKNAAKAAEKAAQQVQRANEKASAASIKASERAAKASEKASAAEQKAAEKSALERIKADDRAMAAKIRNAERTQAAMARFLARAEAEARRSAERVTRAEEREANKRAAATTRAESRAARERQRFADRTSHRATRFFWPNAPIGSMAQRAAGDLLRGAGLDFSLGGSLQRNFETQALSTELSTAGYIEGAEGQSGVRQDPAKLEQEARALAAKKSVRSADVLTATRSYAAISGDLETARKAMPDLIDLSVSTQASLDDVAIAAGLAGEQLKGMGSADKVAAINNILRAVASQGKIGSIEMRDMAGQLPKVAAAAGQFAGDPAEHMVTLGGLMQIAKKFGGAQNAAEAGTAASNLVNTFRKGARVKAFDAAGIKLYDDNNQLRDPLQIIREAIVTTGGDPRKLNNLFMDVRSNKMVQGLTTEFLKAGGAQDASKGLAAVDNLIRANNPAALTQANINKDAGAYQKTGAARAIRAQQAWDNGLVKVRDKLVENFDIIIKRAEQFAQVIGDVTTWVAENPKKAIGAAIGISVGRAILETGFRKGLELLLLRSGLAGAFAGKLGTSGTGGPAMIPGQGVVLGGAMPAINTLSRSAGLATMTVQALAVTGAFTGGWMLGKEMGEAIADALNNNGGDVERDLESGNKRAAYEAAFRGTERSGSAKSLKTTEKAYKGYLKDLDAQIVNLDSKSAPGTGRVDEYGRTIGERSREEDKKLSGLLAEREELRKGFESLKGSTLSVRIVEDETAPKVRTSWVTP